MSDAIAFDSHEFVKNLIQNGFTEKQAEVLAKEQVALLNDNLASKQDIEALRQGTKQDIEALRQETKQDIDALRQETKQSIEVMRVEVKRDLALLQRDIERIKSDLVKWMLAALLGHSLLVVSLVVALV